MFVYLSGKMTLKYLVLIVLALTPYCHMTSGESEPIYDYYKSGWEEDLYSIRSQSIYDFTYFTDRVETCASSPPDHPTMAKAKIVNRSGTRFISRDVAYANWFKCAWSFESNTPIEDGASISMTSPIPTFDDDQSVLFLDDKNFTYTGGDAMPFSEENTIQIGMYVPAESSRIVSISGMLYRSTIPFTASMNTVYKYEIQNEDIVGELAVYHLKDMAVTYD